MAGLQQAETEVAMYCKLERIQSKALLPDGTYNRACTNSRAPTRLRTHYWDAETWSGSRRVAFFYERAAPAILAVGAPMWFYVVYVGTAPVASAELTIGGGVIGTYNISTLSPYRRGIGTAMALRRLLDAREQGHHTAILQASADGEWLYTNLGFKSYGTITEFKPAQ